MIGSAPRSGCVCRYKSVSSIVFFLFLYILSTRSFHCSFQAVSLSLFSHLRSVVYTFNTRTAFFLFRLALATSFISLAWCACGCICTKSIGVCACMNGLSIRTQMHGSRTHSGKDKHTCSEQIKSTTTITFEVSTEMNAHTASNQACVYI